MFLVNKYLFSFCQIKRATEVLTPLTEIKRDNYKNWQAKYPE